MMLKDILVLLMDEADEAAIAVAQALRGKGDAHCDAVLLGEIPNAVLAPDATGLWAELINKTHEDWRTKRKALSLRLEREGRSFDLELLTGYPQELSNAAARRARYADISIMQRKKKESFFDTRRAVFEGLLFESGRPLLLTPPDWRGERLGERVLIAWNDSAQSARAVAEAETFLEDAKAIRVVTVRMSAEEDGAARLAKHLGRRGIEVDVRYTDEKDASFALKQEAKAFDADLIVMGGFGRARFLETVFGGVTDELARTASLPLLMAH